MPLNCAVKYGENGVFLLCDLYHKKEKNKMKKMKMKMKTKEKMKKGKMDYKSKMRGGSPGKALVEIRNTNQGHLDRDAAPPNLMKSS